MPDDVVEKYQIAGLDERERGFSRLVDMEQVEDLYRAVLRYEKTTVITDAHKTTDRALMHLVELLRERGYTQLKSRLNFRGAAYLGSQEPWIDYPDPDRAPELAIRPISEQLARRTGWIGRVLRLFGE
ncbi:MAG TPA: hypothetical protein VJ692_10605 [Nitrospiraceae bacterium]|nr:hypothetical protein [Nitrospiraceae bacterium]